MFLLATTYSFSQYNQKLKLELSVNQIDSICKNKRSYIQDLGGRIHSEKRIDGKKPIIGKGSFSIIGFLPSILIQFIITNLRMCNRDVTIHINV